MDTIRNKSFFLSRCYILVLLFVVHVLSHGNIEARRMDEVKKRLEHGGTVKTIVADHGDTIDCVDIYKQPSFKHPLINDIQMEPSSYPNGLIVDASIPPVSQGWHKFGECPQGTIPIRRTSLDQGPLLYPASPFGSRGDHFNRSHQLAGFPANEHQFASVGTGGNMFQGAQGIFSTWNPKVEDINEFSSSQINVENDVTVGQGNPNSLQSGWIVYPKRYNDNNTRVFLFWKNDENKLGCYDLDCAGFVQTNNKISLGALITPVSTYGVPGYEWAVNIFKDRQTNNWWLQLSGTTIGYWDASLLQNLKDGAAKVSWGGEIVNTRSSGHHTTTEMGSGHFSSEGQWKASYVRDIRVTDGSFTTRSPFLLNFVSNSKCYDLSSPNSNKVFYGGPGYSASCV